MINDSFSLMRGGPVYRLMRALRLVGHGKRTETWVALLLTVVALGPLLVLTAMAGTLLPGFSTVRMPLLGDYAVIARFLVAMPLLVLTARICDTLLEQALLQFSRSGMVHPLQRSPFDAILQRMQQLRDSNLPELACLALAVTPALLGMMPVGLLHGVSDWAHGGDGLTAAGEWFGLVSTSIFRFVALIWVWRFLLWAWLLWRCSRIDLDVRAAHPDRAGGLGFLGVIQQRFSVLAVAGGVLVAGYGMNQMIYLDQTLHDLRHVLLGFIVVSTVGIVAPLLVMTPLLLKAKRNGLLLYSGLGHDAAHTFDRRWLAERAPDAPALLDTGDASAVCDFTGVYDTVRGMAILPISRWNVLWIAGAAAIPLLPLAFVAFSVDEVLQRLGSILL